jgi:hypothetical protein
LWEKFIQNSTLKHLKYCLHMITKPLFISA